MSNVGPEAVSLRDLIKLGPQALGAMAQGQQPSIAPSYMVLAALKAVTDMQKGQPTAQPTQTVKDMVVAGAQPQGAMMSGIAEVPQPVRSFSGGGRVDPLRTALDLGATRYEEAFNRGITLSPYDSPQEREEKLRRLGALIQMERTPAPPIPTGVWERDTEGVMRNIPESMRPTLNNPNYSNEGRNYPRPTVSTTPAATTVAPSAAEQEQPLAVRASASSTSRSGTGGIRGIGRSPFERYSKEEVSRRPLGEIDGLNAPKNEFLEQALAKFSTPDEARLAELRQAEETAGLSAFARGILKGRGFGGAFGPAVADMMDAREAKAEKRRSYQDAREKMALELGLKKGTEEYQRFMDDTKFRQDVQNQEVGDARAERKRSDEIVTATNQRILDEQKLALEQQKIALQAETNRIAAEVRRDGLDQRKFERLMSIQERAYRTAEQVAKNEIDADLTLQARAAGNPALIENTRAQIRERVYRQLFPQAYEALISEGLGVPAAPAVTQPAAGIRARMPG